MFVDKSRQASVLDKSRQSTGGRGRCLQTREGKLQSQTRADSQLEGEGDACRQEQVSFIPRQEQTVNWRERVRCLQTRAGKLQPQTRAANQLKGREDVCIQTSVRNKSRPSTTKRKRILLQTRAAYHLSLKRSYCCLVEREIFEVKSRITFVWTRADYREMFSSPNFSAFCFSSVQGDGGRHR